MIFIEILIIVIILVQIWLGYKRGFIAQLFDLGSILLSFFIALHYFGGLAQLFERWGASQVVSKPLAFFSLWVILLVVFYMLTVVVFRYIPVKMSESFWNRLLGLIPGFIKGILIAAITLTLLFVIPTSPTFKDDLTKYPISGFFIKTSAQTKSQLDKILGGLNNLNFFGQVAPTEEETTTLNFKVERYKIDENSEKWMFARVNSDRAKAGLKPLALDNTITVVARNHSIDMAQNGYFSHIDQAGTTPADRMTVGGVKYWLAGENIALAPSAELAEIGFMNSPKHRDNILDPNFGRIGIGIIDIGQYGKMVTQNFAD